MKWADILEDKSLRDLPYKIEMNGFGQIVMSPASNRHSFYQGEIQWRIRLQMTEGKCYPECSIQTTDGVKVPDVVWLSDDFFRDNQYVTPYPQAPELCVEVISPSNSQDEIDHKVGLYFQHGAKEVWTCDEAGRMEFLLPAGTVAQSKLFPQFPTQI